MARERRGHDSCSFLHGYTCPLVDSIGSIALLVLTESAGSVCYVVVTLVAFSFSQSYALLVF